MALKISTYNVLVYEPEGVQPGLKIGRAVLDGVLTRSNRMISDTVLSQFVKQGLVPEGTSLQEFTTRAPELDASGPLVAVPEEARFVVNTAPYERMDGIPGVLGEFADVYEQLAPQGIAVTFLNTAYESPANDFGRLTELLERFPAMLDSTWVVTTSLRQPMPKPFKEKIAELRGGAPGGKSGKHLTITEGLPCLVPIGDSIVITAKDEAARIAYERLKYIRKWEQKD